MITAYVMREGGLDAMQLKTEDNRLPQDAIWLDAYRLSDEEREWRTDVVLKDVPEEEELDDIEASSRFFLDSDGIHILSLFPQRVGNETIGVNVSFTLKGKLLISYRDDDIGVLRLLRHYIKHDSHLVSSALDVILELQDLKIEYLSDLIEDGYETLQENSKHVLKEDQTEEMLRELLFQESTNGQIHLALHDTRRSLRFILKVLGPKLSEKQHQNVMEVLADIESLLPHTQFLFDKIDFQLEAATGFTNLQQNRVIKMFSVVAVLFMPPTLIASLYGMNFAHMPELSLKFGYPLALLLMVASACFTYLFFKKKKWM